MQLDKLIYLIECYYELKYNDTQVSALQQYLSEKSEAFLEHTFRIVVKRFSQRYNKLPGVAEIEEYAEEIRQSIPTRNVSYEERAQISDQDRQQVAQGLHQFLQGLGRRKTVVPFDVEKAYKTGGKPATDVL